MEKKILIATLPIATSANSAYKNNGRGGKVLSADAVAYTDNVLAILNYPNAAHGGSPPYKVHHIDIDTINFIRSLKFNKSRSKKVLALHRYYKIREDLYFNDWSCDLDNPHKLEQDVLCSWMGFNDSKMVEIHSKKIVVPGINPYVNIVVTQRDPIELSPNALIYEAMTELELMKMYTQPYYGDDGEKKEDASFNNILDGRKENAV
jgi:Holliday junction resolvase RusA-like endonuclease